MGPNVQWMTQRRDDVPAHNEWLGPREALVLDSKRFLKRRADWRLGRWTVKRALQACFGPAAPGDRDIEVIAARDGAPEAYLYGSPAPATISLSHSEGVALCAVGEPGAVLGCDVEHIESRSDAFVEDYFCPAEREVVRSVPKLDRPLVTTLIWSAKESALKAMREGLRIDTREVVVSFATDPDEDGWATLAVVCAARGKRFSGWWHRDGDYICTLVRG